MGVFFSLPGLGKEGSREVESKIKGQTCDGEK